MMPTTSSGPRGLDPRQGVAGRVRHLRVALSVAGLLAALGALLGRFYENGGLLRELQASEAGLASGGKTLISTR